MGLVDCHPYFGAHKCDRRRVVASSVACQTSIHGFTRDARVIGVADLHRLVFYGRPVPLSLPPHSRGLDHSDDRVLSIR